MSKLRLVLPFFVLTFLVFSFSSCKKCRNEDPTVRIINNGTKVASVQIKTSGGNTENLNNVQAGTSSEFRSYAPGTVTYTISVEQVPYVETVEMEECFQYDIIIDENNDITTIPTDRND